MPWIRTNAVGLVIAVLLAANLVVQATEAKAESRAVTCKTTDTGSLTNKSVAQLDPEVAGLISTGAGSQVAVIPLADGVSGVFRVMVCTW